MPQSFLAIAPLFHNVFINRQTSDRQTDRQTDIRQTYRLTDRPTHIRQTDRQTSDRQTDRHQTDRETDRHQIDRQTDRQTDNCVNFGLSATMTINSTDLSFVNDTVNLILDAVCVC